MRQCARTLRHPVLDSSTSVTPVCVKNACVCPHCGRYPYSLCLHFVCPNQYLSVYFISMTVSPVFSFVSFIWHYNVPSSIFPCICFVSLFLSFFYYLISHVVCVLFHCSIEFISVRKCIAYMEDFTIIR